MRSERAPRLMTNFRVTPTFSTSSESYQVARFFPRFDSLPGVAGSLSRREREARVPREAMNETLSTFLADTQKIGLELGQHDPAVRLLRVAGVGLGPSREDPQLEPGYARMRIKDEQGNDVTFRMTYEMQKADAKDREWDRVVVRLEKARLDGHYIHLTPEMKREGFTFLSHNMPEILSEARAGKPTRATIRQETPDAACFYDGHHASAGRHDLGCMCKEEREKSLDIIHERGGINSLMPGTGNGNGSEAQDIQISVRNGAARRGKQTLSYHEIYGRMNKKADGRQEALQISTLLLEHLFQMQNVTNLTILSDSGKKRDVWRKFGSIHDVVLEPLNISPQDSADFAFKRRLGYVGSGNTSLPLASR